MILIPPLNTGAREAEPLSANELLRKSLEEKYGYEIEITEGFLNNETFYSDGRELDTKEKRKLQILKDIETAFSMLPEGFVKEVNDKYKSIRRSPSIVVRGRHASDAEGTAAYWDSGSSTIVLYGTDSVTSVSLLHELAHQLETCMLFSDGGETAVQSLEETFKVLNDGISYDENYEAERNASYYKVFCTKYSSKNFGEDIAETFVYAAVQPRYLSSVGKGEAQPIHEKIKAVSELLEQNFTALKNKKFLLNALPDPPAAWAKNDVAAAGKKGIILWGTYGLNTFDITRYDGALLMREFLHTYKTEQALYNGNHIEKNAYAQDFVYDVSDPEDVVRREAA